MQPATGAASIDPGRVDMEQRRTCQFLFDLELEKIKARKGILVEIDDESGADRHMHLVEKVFSMLHKVRRH